MSEIWQAVHECICVFDSEMRSIGVDLLMLVHELCHVESTLVFISGGGFDLDCFEWLSRCRSDKKPITQVVVAEHEWAHDGDFCTVHLTPDRFSVIQMSIHLLWM